jgi:hypothetical protein
MGYITLLEQEEKSDVAASRENKNINLLPISFSNTLHDTL